MEYLLLIAGLALLIVSGELLVKGAVGLAKGLNISTLVIGMTVVSFGTSLPELLVSLKAALNGHPDISIGNVVGSNMANVALVLGLTAIVLPVSVSRNSIRFDWPMMMGVTLLFTFFIWNGMLVFWEGLLLFAALVVFNAWLIRDSRRQENHSKDGEEKVTLTLKSLSIFIGLIAAGCVGLMFGADWLLSGAVGLATALGVSDHVIAVTIVAFGTSVPELITSLVAAFKKETDISVGNLIGSNLFNICAILGITSMVSEIPIAEQVLNVDIYWLLGLSLFILPVLIIGKKIGRIKGALLFLIYLSYIFIQL